MQGDGLPGALRRQDPVPCPALVTLDGILPRPLLVKEARCRKRHRAFFVGSWHGKCEMKSSTATNCETCVARSLAPEDLRCGDFVGVLREIAEYPSFLWCGDSQMLAPDEPVRIEWRADDGGTPLKVKAICLPFVFVKAPCGRHRTLDVRQCQLVRLETDYARLAWKWLKRQKTPRNACRKLTAES